MSDRIKKIKIKQSDGTFSDYIPIGANAKDIDFQHNGNNVENTLKKKPYYYDNVEKMKLDDSLQIGDMAITLGYYEPNDGGEAIYEIIDGESLESDEKSVYELNNKLKAKIILENDIANIKQFGAKANDNTFDNSVIIQYCLDTYLNAFIPYGTFWVNNTILIRRGYTIKGISKYISVLKSIGVNMMFRADFDGFGNEKFLFENLSFDGNNTAINCFWCGNSGYAQNDTNSLIKQCLIYKFNGYALKFEQSIREVYLDSIEIRDCKDDCLILGEGATDCVINNVVCHNSEKNGFTIIGHNNRLSNCKAFWCGRNFNAEKENRKHGFFIQTDGIKLVNCDAQENAYDGFHCENTTAVQFISCSADRNGQPLTDWSNASPENTYGSGFKLIESYDYYIQGQIKDFLKWTNGQTQKYGVNIEESNNGYINIIGLEHEWEIPYYITNSHNIDLFLNGKQYYKSSILSRFNPNQVYLRHCDESNNFGCDMYLPNARFYFGSNSNDSFRIDSFNKNDSDNYQWTGTPIKITNEGDIHIGRYNTKIGFYDVEGVSLQTISETASDLESVIILANNLKTALTNLGLIKE